MTPSTRLRVGLTGLAALIAAGTAGYVAIEGASTFDALYMVIITITTVGFAEQFPLSPTGQILTIVLMVGGIGLAFYTAIAGIEQLFAYGETRKVKRMQRMIEHLSGHVILAGFGRVGRGVWQTLSDRGIDVVVIEVQADRVGELERAGALFVHGDATHNDVLEEAGIESARALVACVREDSDNLVIVLSSRALRQDLHIVSRASEFESESKLRLAGANRVVAPQVVGSERLAAMAIEPELAEIFDVFVAGRSVEFSVEELRVAETSSLVGKTIRDSGLREDSGALVLAVEDRERRLLTTPSPDQVIEPNALMIIVGSQDQVQKAEKLLGG